MEAKLELADLIRALGSKCIKILLCSLQNNYILSPVFEKNSSLLQNRDSKTELVDAEIWACSLPTYTWTDSQPPSCPSSPKLFLKKKPAYRWKDQLLKWWLQSTPPPGVGDGGRKMTEKSSRRVLEGGRGEGHRKNGCAHPPNCLFSRIDSSSNMGSRVDLCKVNPVFLFTVLEMCSVATNCSNRKFQKAFKWWPAPR